MGIGIQFNPLKSTSIHLQKRRTTSFILSLKLTLNRAHRQLHPISTSHDLHNNHRSTKVPSSWSILQSSSGKASSYTSHLHQYQLLNDNNPQRLYYLFMLNCALVVCAIRGCCCWVCYGLGCSGTYPYVFLFFMALLNCLRKVGIWDVSCDMDAFKDGITNLNTGLLRICCRGI